MDGDMKKRKAVEDDSSHEDEDAKVEEFFALIRSTRDIRDRLIREGTAISQQQPVADSKREPKVWIPKFELEDFADGNRLPPLPASRDQEASGSKPKEDDIKEGNEQGKQKDGKGLDLKLSL